MSTIQTITEQTSEELDMFLDDNLKNILPASKSQKILVPKRDKLIEAKRNSLFEPQNKYVLQKAFVLTKMMSFLAPLALMITLTSLAGVYVNGFFGIFAFAYASFAPLIYWFSQFVDQHEYYNEPGKASKIFSFPYFAAYNMIERLDNFMVKRSSKNELRARKSYLEACKEVNVSFKQGTEKVIFAYLEPHKQGIDIVLAFTEKIYRNSDFWGESINSITIKELQRKTIHEDNMVDVITDYKMLAQLRTQENLQKLQEQQNEIDHQTKEINHNNIALKKELEETLALSEKLLAS